MKKLWAILMALLLVGGALAEGAFSLENGVTWGMTEGDVLAMEGTADTEFANYSGFETLEVDDVAFRGHEADVSYLFVNDALLMVAYELDIEDVDPAALVQQLDGEYGAHVDDKGAAYYSFISRLTGTLYTMQPQVSGIGVNWTLPDGTLATLLTGLKGADDDDITVIYINAGASRWNEDVALSEPAPALD